MADVFISYASDDRPRVAPLVQLLEDRGISVWWDRSLNPGQTWPEVIERELTHAGCVVVAWSKQSVESPWVRLEAHHAKRRRNLIPVRLDGSPIPSEYATFQAFDLRGTPEPRELEQFGAAITAQLRHNRWRRVGTGLAGVAVVAAIAATGTCLLSDRCGTWSLRSTEIPEASFAVMANSIDISDAQTRGVLQVFVDDVRRNLRRVAIGKVSPRAETSSLPPGVSARDLGTRLRVRYVLALTIRGDADSLHVLAELIDTSNGYLTDDWRIESSVLELNALNTTLVRDVAGRFVETARPLASATDTPDDAYVQYLEARAALREGGEARLGRAQEIFESILARSPEFGRAEAGLCQVHLARYENTRSSTQFDLAERHCNRALQMDPEPGDAAVALGEMYLQQGRYREAREAFVRASKDAETVSDGHMGLGEVALAESRIADAEREFRLAVDAEPGYWRTYSALGNFLFHTGRGAEALAAHRRAAALAKHDGVALNNVGAALFLSGQLEAAISAWQATLDATPQASAYSNLGAAYYLLGDFDRAVQMYERSVALVADDYRVWTNLGDARAYANRPNADDAYQTAMRLLEAELDKNPTDPLTCGGSPPSPRRWAKPIAPPTRSRARARTHAPTTGNWI